MGVRAGGPGDAGPRAASARAARDRAPRAAAARRRAAAAGLTAALLASSAAAEGLRLAAWGADLSRDGPGLLLRDIGKGDDPGVEGAVAVLAALGADVVLLTDIDWDADGAALSALAARLAAEGLDYPHRLALPSNAGLPSGLDLDGDGRTGTPRDAQGYGRFRGDGAMALLSRWPLGAARDLTGLPWRDLPGARPPVAADGSPFPSEAAQAAQRLSSTGHWVVPVETPIGPVAILAWAATPPVFDGPEDLNGRRAGDEAALWLRLLDGAWGPPPDRVVVMGEANLDPADGEGPREAVAALLADPRLQDPGPRSDGAREAADPGQRGDPALDTADWPGGAPGEGPGNLRTTYVLPSAGLGVQGAGVLWPREGEPLADALAAAGPHRPVWVDLAVP